VLVGGGLGGGGGGGVGIGIINGLGADSLGMVLVVFCNCVKGTRKGGGI